MADTAGTALSQVTASLAGVSGQQRHAEQQHQPLQVFLVFRRVPAGKLAAQTPPLLSTGSAAQITSTAVSRDETLTSGAETERWSKRHLLSINEIIHEDRSESNAGYFVFYRKGPEGISHMPGLTLRQPEICVSLLQT